jgi:hypothetical protein
MSNPQTYLNIVNALNSLVAPGGAPIVSSGVNSAPAGYAAVGIGGPTANRPKASDPGVTGSGVTVGAPYLDTTISAVVVWDGAAWRNPFTGATA